MWRLFRAFVWGELKSKFNLYIVLVHADSRPTYIDFCYTNDFLDILFDLMQVNQDV